MSLPEFSLNCPLPSSDNSKILMAHGGGGRLMQRLIGDVFLPSLQGQHASELHDGALLQVGDEKLAFTTDSFVVRPLFFPGGDIGDLAVNGTVNDLAMCGARPLYLSAGFILEEGLPTETLRRIVASMQRAAQAAGVQFVTGDTKVVDKGKGDGVFINTAGIGVIETDLVIAPHRVRDGDAILLSGDIGRHGIAIMAEREGLAFESAIESDCAPLNGIIQELLQNEVEIHCLRDATRGGVASVLVEIAEASRLPLHIHESRLPVREDVQGACEILGLDPLYVANEGRFVAFVAERDAGRALEIMRRHPQSEGAVQIGTVEGADAGLVTMQSVIGANRIIDLLSGEQLPRIC